MTFVYIVKGFTYWVSTVNIWTLMLAKIMLSKFWNSKSEFLEICKVNEICIVNHFVKIKVCSLFSENIGEVTKVCSSKKLWGKSDLFFNWLSLFCLVPFPCHCLCSLVPLCSPFCLAYICFYSSSFFGCASPSVSLSLSLTLVSLYASLSFTLSQFYFSSVAIFLLCLPALLCVWYVSHLFICILYVCICPINRLISFALTAALKNMNQSSNIVILYILEFHEAEQKLNDILKSVELKHINFNS